MMKSRNAIRIWSSCMLCASLLVYSGCGEADTGIRGSGTVEATEVTISARVGGEILTMEVSEGARVEQGDTIARIDAEDLELQLEQQQQRLRRLYSNLELLEQGAEPEDIRQAEAGLDQAEQTLELARSSYERTKNLLEKGSATPSEFDRAKTELGRAQAGVASARARLDKLETMPRPEEVEAMRAQIAEADAGIRRTERRIRDATLIAPRAGTIVTVAREEGEYVNPGTPLCTLADLSEVYLTIYIGEPKLGRISLGQQAEIFVDGMPDTEFSGRVSRIAEEAEFTPKNVQTRDARAELVYAVEITIDNRRGIFKIGMPADARIDDGGSGGE